MEVNLGQLPPLPTILVVAGVLFLLLTVASLGGRVVLRFGLEKVSLIIGIGLIVMGTALYMTDLPQEERPSVTEPVPAEVPGDIASPTVLSVLDTTDQVPSPSIAPTASPNSPVSLEGDCVDSQIWTPVMGDNLTRDNRGCWQLGEWGMAMQKDRGLVLIVRNASEDLVHGIYTPVEQSGSVELSLRIDTLYTAADGAPTNLAFALVPLDSPTLANGTVFKIQVETSWSGSPIFLKAIEPGQIGGGYLGGRYVLGNTRQVRLEFGGGLLSVYWDEAAAADGVRVPTGELALWIGYRVAKGGKLSATVQSLSLRP